MTKAEIDQNNEEIEKGIKSAEEGIAQCEEKIEQLEALGEENWNDEQKARYETLKRDKQAKLVSP